VEYRRGEYSLDDDIDYLRVQFGFAPNAQSLEEGDMAEWLGEFQAYAWKIASERMEREGGENCELVDLLRVPNEKHRGLVMVALANQLTPFELAYHEV
jgi:hypothetical protein